MFLAATCTAPFFKWWGFSLRHLGVTWLKGMRWAAENTKRFLFTSIFHSNKSGPRSPILVAWIACLNLSHSPSLMSKLSQRVMCHKSFLESHRHHLINIMSETRIHKLIVLQKIFLLSAREHMQGKIKKVIKSRAKGQW